MLLSFLRVAIFGGCHVLRRRDLVEFVRRHACRRLVCVCARRVSCVEAGPHSATNETDEEAGKLDVFLSFFFAWFGVPLPWSLGRESVHGHVGVDSPVFAWLCQHLSRAPQYLRTHPHVPASRHGWGRHASMCVCVCVCVCVLIWLGVIYKYVCVCMYACVYKVRGDIQVCVCLCVCVSAAWLGC